jgi:hypothetical protein
MSNELIYQKGEQIHARLLKVNPYPRGTVNNLAWEAGVLRSLLASAALTDSKIDMHIRRVCNSIEEDARE